MIHTGKHKVIQVVDTSCPGNTAHSVGVDEIPAVTDPCHPQTTQDTTSAQGGLDCVDNNVRTDADSSQPAKMTDRMHCALSTQLFFSSIFFKNILINFLLKSES